MGNLFGKSESVAEESKSRSFGHVVDYIASHYILTMDFQSLTKLYEKQYCDNLVVLTKDIIERNFNDLEITYLAQRTQKGVVIDKQTTDNVIFFNKQDMDKMDVGSALKKKRICIGIAKFYVKIAHLFSAIVTTINPVYSYKDDQGNLIKQPLAQKDSIPANVERKLHKLSLCSRRIDILKGSQDWKRIPENGDFTVNPKVCSDTKQSLQEEPGIPELMHLYCDKPFSDDNFQKTCDFKSMSNTAQRHYKEDLHRFYKAFTGKDEVPADLMSFSQIKLRDYNSCKNAPSARAQSFRGNLKDELFGQYAENLRTMIHNANDNQAKLLDVINELFTYDVVDEKKLIRVKPTLTEAILQELTEKTRRIIVQMYLKCEEDFERGVKLYEAIVENQILHTTQSQIKQLEKLSQKVVSQGQGQRQVPVPVQEQAVQEQEQAVQVQEQAVPVPVQDDRSLEISTPQQVENYPTPLK
jgi:hypothetical protein